MYTCMLKDGTCSLMDVSSSGSSYLVAVFSVIMFSGCIELETVEVMSRGMCLFVQKQRQDEWTSLLFNN